MWTGSKSRQKTWRGSIPSWPRTVDNISLTAENDGSTSRLTLSANGIELSSADITFYGMVTFADLAGSGRSLINGDKHHHRRHPVGERKHRVQPGKRVSPLRPHRGHPFRDQFRPHQLVCGAGGHQLPHRCAAQRVRHQLSGGQQQVCQLRLGGRGGAEQLYRHAGGGPTRHTARFNTAQVDIASGNLGVAGAVSTRDLSVWGSKNRIVRTPLGNLAFAAMESPNRFSAISAAARWGRTAPVR